MNKRELIRTKVCSRKDCPRSGISQPIGNFYSNPSRKSGIRCRCKTCDIELSKNYFREHKEEKKEYDRQYKQSLSGRFSQYHKDVKKRKIVFLLTLEQFDSLTSQVCEYCGEYSKDKLYAGIDKVDPNKGYILQNCIPCCDICNWMKSDTSQDEFFTKVDKIYKKRHKNE